MFALARHCCREAKSNQRTRIARRIGLDYLPLPLAGEGGVRAVSIGPRQLRTPLIPNPLPKWGEGDKVVGHPAKVTEGGYSVLRSD